MKPERALVLCGGEADLAALARLAPAERVDFADIGDFYQPEKALAALAELAAGEKLLLFPSGHAGAELAPRLAFRLGGCALADVLAARADGDKLKCLKTVYSRELRAEFALTRGPVCASLAKGAAEKKESPGSGPRQIRRRVFDGAEPAAFVLERQATPEERAAGLSKARLLVLAGQGVGGTEGVARLARFAAAIGAELGVSRPAAMRAWAPLNRLVGVSGAMTAPDLCLAFGVSGAAALYAGIEKSKFIAAVNRDPKAPIIRRADVAVVEDWGAVLLELQRLIGMTGKE